MPIMLTCEVCGIVFVCQPSRADRRFCSFACYNKHRRRKGEQNVVAGEKHCTKCGELRPLEQFPKYTASSDGHYSWCKECKAKVAKEYREKHPEQEKARHERWRRAKGWISKAEKTHKLCPACGEYKLFSEFAPRKRRKTRDGLAAYCRQCAAQKRREQYWKDPELSRANARKDSERYARINPEANAIWAANRRARINDAGGTLTPEQWAMLKQDYEYTCLCCGKQEPVIKLTIDHILPITKGGSSDVENIQPLCQSCNCKKHTETIDYRVHNG